MLSAFANIWKVPELKKRILFTLGIVLLVRLGCAIPLPGIDSSAVRDFLEEFMRTSKNRGAADFMDWFNMFSGGAIQQSAIFSLGIMPYITASIIMQLLTAVIPALKRMVQEGESGRQQFIQYTRYLTVIICLGQAFALAAGIVNSPDFIYGGGAREWALSRGRPFVTVAPWQFIALSVATMTCGTVFIMWLGEQITERGIGNGASMIITVGIIDRLPHAMIQAFNFFFKGSDGTGGADTAFMLVPMLAMLLISVAFVIALTQGVRKIPVQYAKRVVGRKMTQGGSTFMPLRINYAGVMPIIFGQALLVFPVKILSVMPYQPLRNFANLLRYGGPTYEIAYSLLILFFAYFWVATQFDPIQISDDLKKHGGYIPGIRPGEGTSEYLDFIMTRITLAGAVALMLIAVVPDYVGQQGLGVPRAIASFFGGTSLLIMVGVMLDTMRQVESHLLMRHYDGFLKKGKLRGRR